MILVDTADMGELLHCILVWDVAAASVSRNALAAQYVIYSLSVPSDDIEGRVLLFAREKLTPDSARGSNWGRQNATMNVTHLYTTAARRSRD